MMQFVTPQTTFEELYFYMNDFIQKSGYINLDFMGNLGHSIVTKKDSKESLRILEQYIVY